MAPCSETLPELQKYDVLRSTTEKYLVLELVGQGCFGTVAKCINLRTAKSTAIKIHNNFKDHLAEVDMLHAIMDDDPEKTNLVEVMEDFVFQDLYCIAFEMLDTSLWDLVNPENTLSLNEIRVITHQLLVAFQALDSNSIIHADLKPDNVMLVNHQDQPFKVKLIDFGLARKASEVKVGMRMQNLAYRAPEVMLGLPITEAVDMWGLGCVLAYLFFGRTIFPSNCEYNKMKAVCDLLGQSADHLLDAGINTRKYFIQEQGYPRWRLKTPQEYMDTTGVQLKITKSVLNPARNLKEAVKLFSKENGHVEDKDRMAFIDLLQELLDQDADTRITPRQALKHRFVTMTHLKEDLDTSSYAEAADELMAVCTLDDSNDSSDRDLFTDDSSDGGSSTDDFTSVSSLLSKNEIIRNKSTEYCVVNTLGKGGFGQVFMCVDTKTSEKVAIKILTGSENQITEVKILQEIKALDPEKTNMVKFIDSFMLRGMFCVTCEMLDMSLFDFMLTRQTLLSLNEICLITRQLLLAFEALKTLSIIHADVQPSNVMLVNHQDQPFKVKLIDFGLAVKACETVLGMQMQPISYRAPEVMLGLPVTEAIDMWGLGCVMAFLFFGRHLFLEESHFYKMKAVCDLLGQPADHLLDAGINTRKYFIQEQDTGNPRWRLKTPKEYMDTNEVQFKITKSVLNPARNLKEAVKQFPEEEGHVEDKDRMVFVDLLQQLLDQDPDTRITPSQALKHRFVTMTHL